ncbi:MAG: glycosyltransferase family 4 protein [Chromatiales bacterium]|nr:glycosyltransferase family 4 protein [Chromatiales bacterium]
MKKVFLLQEIVPSYRVPVFRRLAALPGVELTVFYSRPGREMAAENLRNATDLTGFRAVRLRLLEFGSQAWQPGILWQLLRGRPDVLITGQAGRPDLLLALLLCKVLGVRVLWFLGGVPYTDPDRIRAYAARGRLRRWFGPGNPRDWLSRQADGLIVYSAHARGYYAAQGYDPRRIWVAPNSPDTEILEAAGREWAGQPERLAADRQRWSPAGEPVLFLLGRLNRARKVDTLLRALARLRQEGLGCALVIVGDGSERAALEAQAASLGLPNVHFEGAVYEERELARYFLLCDLFVTPGVASLAIKMALAFGKPVVTVDYGLEVHDIVDGVNGFVFPMDDDAALAARIRQVLGSGEQQRAMGREALRTIRERVNISLMINAFRRAIDDDLDPASATHGPGPGPDAGG